jgi:hypothetical protein
VVRSHDHTFFGGMWNLVWNHTQVSKKGVDLPGSNMNLNKIFNDNKDFVTKLFFLLFMLFFEFCNKILLFIHAKISKLDQESW